MAQLAFDKFKSVPAYVTLLSILIVGAVALAISTMILILSLGNSLTVQTASQEESLDSIAETCAEEALFQISQNPSFSGTQSLNLFEEGSCTYTVILGVGETRTIQIEANFRDLVRRIHLELDQISPYVNVNVWEPVDVF